MKAVKRTRCISVYLTDKERELLEMAACERGKETYTTPGASEYVRALILADLKRRGITG
jgi:DNA-binding MarR family transcriptional regulator